MFDKEPLDIVLICADNAGTVDIVEAAAAKKIHIQSEKPMAATLAGADQMLGAVRKTGVRLLVTTREALNLQEAFQGFESVVINDLLPVIDASYRTIPDRDHRALRTETVIGDTRDFGIGRRVTAYNWNALRAVGEGANQRLCDAQAADARPAPDVATFTQVTQPSTDDGLHAPGLRIGDPRVMAILAALVGFAHLLADFANRQLVELVAALLDAPYTARQATYDLRRLRRKGLIVRLPGTFRYQLTPRGRQVAVLFTKAHGRVLSPGLALTDLVLADEIANRNPLAVAWRRLDRELDNFIDAAHPAAA